MKKRFALLFALSLACLPSCGSNTTPSDSMEKHNISLTVDNYLVFLNVTKSGSYGQYSYTFEGCLSYAFYENVTITLRYSNSSGNPIVVGYFDPNVLKEKENYATDTLKLNAAGCGYYNGSGKYGATITDVSGKVIYWM